MDNAARFRKEADKRYGNRRHRTRYPNRLRALALEHLSEVLAGGGRITDAAHDLGIDANSLRAWRHKPEDPGTRSSPSKGGTMRRMSIVTEGAARYIVHGPADVRVECADADSVAALLRALR